MPRKSTPILEIVPAGMDHVASIAARMRQADVDEVWASSRSTPHQALMFSLQRSTEAWTAMLDGRPEVMFGVARISVLGGTGIAWLLGTDTAAEHSRLFVRQSAEWRGKLLERYDVLRNFVSDQNEVSVRWLRWMGAVFSDPAPIGVDGELFRLFELRRADV